MSTTPNQNIKLGPIDSYGLLELWMHQNNLLWNRLQLIAIVQAGVLVGFWHLAHEKNAPLQAIFLAALGWWLSVLTCCILERDIAYRERVRAVLKECLPESMRDSETGPRGHVYIKITAYTFALLDLALIVWVPFVKAN